MPIKKFVHEGPKSKEQVKKDLASARINKNEAVKVPTTKSGRPKGIHTPLKEGNKVGIQRTEQQWAELWDRFFAALATSARVTKSCELAGVSYTEVRRRRAVDPEFEKQFVDAYEDGVQALDDEAVRRAFEGVEKPVFYKGERVDDVKEYSDQLLIFILKGNRPDKYKERTSNENTNFNVDLAERLEQAKKRGTK